MKKLLASMLLVCMVMAMAGTVFAATGATNKCVITEYCENFMYRADRFKYAGLETNIKPDVLGMVLPDSGSGSTVVSVSGGNAFIDPKNLEINEIDIVLHEFEGTSQENNTHLFTAAIGLSVLEGFRDEIFAITKENESSSAAEEGFRILNDEFDEFVDSDEISRAFDGEEVLIYSGNYDYYIRYMYREFDDYTIDEFELVAKTR